VLDANQKESTLTYPIERNTIMFMEAPLLLLADYANFTGDKKLNIMGVFTSIRAPHFPWPHPQMYVVAQFRATPHEHGDFKTEIRLVDADGKRVFSVGADMSVPETDGVLQEKNLGQIFVLNGLVFDKPGDYALLALLNGEEKARYNLVVEHRPKQESK
jgi:hypothetical protein